MTEKLYGTVFNIQHYCIHDGPGIRTGIFLKGVRFTACGAPIRNLRLSIRKFFGMPVNVTSVKHALKHVQIMLFPGQDPEYRQTPKNVTAAAVVLPSVRDRPVLSPENRCPQKRS